MAERPHLRVARTLTPHSEAPFPAWQGMQYLRDMSTGRGKLAALDNGRYGERDWTGTWAELMRRLGYGARWMAQGGDWGAAVVTALAHRRAPGLAGVHLNMVLFRPMDGEVAEATPEERHMLAGAARYEREQSGYMRPNAGASAARLYWENARSLVDGGPNGPIPLPAGVSMFPGEALRLSRRWAERRFTDLRFFNEPDRGGHFAAMENPAAFVEDLRATFALMR